MFYCCRDYVLAYDRKGIEIIVTIAIGKHAVSSQASNHVHSYVNLPINLPLILYSTLARFTYMDSSTSVLIQSPPLTIYTDDPLFNMPNVVLDSYQE